VKQQNQVAAQANLRSKLALHSHSAKSPKYGDISRWLNREAMAAATIIRCNTTKPSCGAG